MRERGRERDFFLFLIFFFALSQVFKQNKNTEVVVVAVVSELIALIYFIVHTILLFYLLSLNRSGVQVCVLLSGIVLKIRNPCRGSRFFFIINLEHFLTVSLQPTHFHLPPLSILSLSFSLFAST